MKFALRQALVRRLRFLVDEALADDEVRARIVGAIAQLPGVHHVELRIATGSLIVTHDGRAERHREIVDLLTSLPPDGGAGETPRVPVDSSVAALAYARDDLAWSALISFSTSILPLPLRAGVTIVRSLPFFSAAVRALRCGQFTSDVLDAAAIATAIGMGDHATASGIGWLLKLGEYMRMRTETRARRDLVASLGRESRHVWLLREGVELEVRQSEVAVDDVVVLRAGYVVPVDGVIVRGIATVNQASLTGESIPVTRRAGHSVYEGTSVVDGELEVRATGVGDGTRLAKLIGLVDQTETEKAGVHRHAEHLADRLVPWVFGMAGLTQLLTGDPSRAASVLLVDYSCALKISVPIAIKASMIDALKAGILIRSGRFVEALATVDTVVFDKTGTLTQARPTVLDVVVLDGFDAAEVIRNTACIEEHFPHPYATAITHEARQRGLAHGDEIHGDVRYLVAQGIVSDVGNRRYVVGSKRFLRQRGVQVDSPRAHELEQLGHSVVFVGVDDRLAAMFVLDDPVREDARETILALRALGIRSLVMLTGDSEAKARQVASLGIDETHAEVSPEEKVRVVEDLKKRGARVAMIGDGINDAPALAAAHVGIAMRHGADLARESSDVLILDEKLTRLPDAIRLSRQAMRRVHSNFRYIAGANSALIGMAFLGLMPPAISALAHNSTTVMTSMRALLPYSSAEKR